VDSVLQESQDQVQEYLSGKEKVFAYFIGQVMRRAQGKFNPALLNEVLMERLNVLKTTGN
jgi:aspartyl-tRNA(Asn)/glutamyl-tRNA(Gln) amidotransferase subunit B